MTTFQFRPLLLWDQPETDPRASGTRFRAGWNETVDLLQREAEHLGAQTIAIQVAADASQIRRDGMLRSVARVGHPGVKVAFNSDFGPLTYATDQYDHWKANVRAIALGLQALRAVDRYGISRRGEQYTGWSALSDKPAGHGDLSVEEARRILSQFPPYSLSNAMEIQHAWRAAAKVQHPDAGGSDSAMTLITKARDVLLAATR